MALVLVRKEIVDVGEGLGAEQQKPLTWRSLAGTGEATDHQNSGVFSPW